MLVYPRTPEQANHLAALLERHAGVQKSTDLKVMGWVDPENLDEVLMVVGFNSFIGKTCQIHVAMLNGFHSTPREVLRVAFSHAFDEFKVEKLIGIVNSKNERAMNYDFRLGFKEMFRMPGMHDHGGDIVMLVMTRGDCRYLQQKKAA